jgi:preprotein translocase subunit SecY
LTRIITLILAFIQSSSVALYLRQVLFYWNYILAIEIIIWLMTGTMIVLWLSELITDYGLGNGTSLLIYTNIILSLPNLCKKILTENSENFTISLELIIACVIFISLYGIVFLQ